MAQIASVVVPVYNESEIVTENIDALVKYLDSTLVNYEVILVENGSIDDTGVLVEQISRENPRVRAFNLPEPCLGKALKTGILNAKHSKVVYYPVDLSVNLSFIPESVALLDAYHIVIGSKKMRTALDNRPLKRRVASTGFHRTVQTLFRTDLSDTTCVKAYRKEVAFELMNAVPTENSVFETEVLLDAQSMGFTVHQIPVEVNDRRKGRLPLRHKGVSKLQDLLSLRMDVLSMIAGVSMFFAGVLFMTYLSLQKLLFNKEGFLNPYSFLISMLLILFGAQGFAYGLFTRLVLQIRKEITLSQSHSGNVFKEERK